MRVLFVSPYVPSLVRIRPYHWITNLAARGHEIRLCALVSGADDLAALDGIRRYCTSITTETMPRWRPWLNCLQALPGRDPLQLAWSRHEAFAAAVGRAASASGVDVVHIEHLRAACFAPAVAAWPVVYDAVDSISLLFAQTAKAGPSLGDRVRARIDLGRTRAFERGMLSTFDRVLVSSSVDASHLRDLAPTAELASRLVVLPNPVDLEYFRPGTGHREPATLIFSGKMSYHANVAAVRHLVERIMPLVWKHQPDVNVLLVGQDPSAAIRALAQDARVTVTGYVPDLRPFLARATLAVCPMVYGVGIQNKVLEAMAAGVPVLASHGAVAALGAEPGRDLAVADSVDDFVTAILKLLASPSDRSFLAGRGRAYVAAHHGGSVLLPTLEATYRRAIHARSARA